MIELLHVLSGPVIGAVIGYFTNYLAVKMLFHPYYPIKIGSWVLPFTPGIIPKRKPHLAKALGGVVGGELLTGEDIKKLLLSEEMEERVAASVMDRLECHGDETLHQLLGQFVEEERYQAKKELLCGRISDVICQEVERLDISSIIVEEGSRVVKEKIKGTMLEMFLSDKVILSVAEPIGDCVNDYVSRHGHELIQQVVYQKVESLEEQSMGNILEDWQIEKEQLKKAVRKVYRKLVESQAEKAVRAVNVAEIVEAKIDAMDVPQLEKLLLSVMKKELSALVNLGAVIGFVIGIINCFL